MRTSRLKNIVIVILLLVNVFLLVLLLSRRAEERGANERRIEQLCELFRGAKSACVMTDADGGRPFIAPYIYTCSCCGVTIADENWNCAAFTEENVVSVRPVSNDYYVYTLEVETACEVYPRLTEDEPDRYVVRLSFLTIPRDEKKAQDHRSDDESYKAFDISLIGTDPAGTLCFPIDEALTGKEIKVYHLSDDGKLTELKIAVKDGRAETAFAQSGIYVVGTTGKAMKNPNTGVPAVSAVALFLAVSAAVCISRSKRRDH